jgi:endonuclease/exonuclease/phosphatase family metal-dependent hydrolase
MLPKRLLAVVGLLMVVPTAAAATPEYDNQPDRPLKVLTYNIHHGQGVDGVLDLERIAAMIDESGADIVRLQEVDKNWSARSDWEDQPAWFAERLDMHVAYAANLDLPPLNPGEPRRQYGTAILSRFPIKDFQNTLLPLYPGQEQRGLLEATIKVRGKDLRFADTHLTSSNNAQRLDQARRVVELRDNWAEVGVGPGYTIEADNPTARIDYVLHSGGLLARSAEVITTNGSDHLPVFAELSLR